MPRFRPSRKDRSRPGRCLIVGKPLPHAVFFCHAFISLSAISLVTGLGVSSISMIFKGTRQPSLRSAKLIAKALNMDIEHFIRRLEDHTALFYKVS